MQARNEIKHSQHLNIYTLSEISVQIKNEYFHGDSPKALITLSTHRRTVEQKKILEFSASRMKTHIFCHANTQKNGE